MTIDRGRRRAGFTLAEAMIAMVLLGLAAAGVLLPFSQGAEVQAEGTRMTLGAQLADGLLERIVATPASQIVATWNGHTEAPGHVTDAGGAVFTDPLYANFSRQVTCYDNVYVPQQSGPPLASNFLLVSVRVSYAGRDIATLSRLISK
jgi:prepilin-type N-terminal cleavage/methylation domain-containing protein